MWSPNYKIMLPFNISTADASIVNIERKRHISPMIRDRMHVLHLVYIGYKRGEAAKIVGCHKNSVTNFIRMYNDGGVEAVRQTNYPKVKHALSERFAEVSTLLESSHCTTVNQARKLLKKQFGYRGKRETVRRLLHRLGFRRRKLGTFPGNIKNLDVWLDKQDEFIEKLKKLLEKALKGELHLTFGDASHFVYGKFSSYTWQQVPHMRSSGHGRHRINVYGAYDAVSKQVYSMYNEGYVDADFIFEYLGWLREEFYTDRSTPLHIVMDNARYQHCKYVKERAEELNIVLEFMPPYSPNLNLIERLWKYLKGLIGEQYFETKQEFKTAIVKLLESLGNKKHQKKIKSLMTFKFKQFRNSQILTS